ncbi:MULTISPECIES: initiation control protein YabA [unclassified Streptococcus]|uniref:initiation control protein YabA n=1 Tax=unclassified Streptococcus TaxID=2608887 RepID=UPI0010721E0E|nr:MULTISPECIES: initiation control protein YabA [unclassified Streptococcus]MBF0806012.1 DUF972 family protein [Streptococcus sp. 19428wA2_WM07]TFU28416.1 DUF972 family protein [Streptococcus sp. WM07]
MEKKDILVTLDNFSNHLIRTLNDLESMKLAVREAIEENTLLRLENEKLRERLSQMETETPVKTPNQREGLNRIYLDGFHVCTYSYGQQREGECVFCDELLNRG